MQFIIIDFNDCVINDTPNGPCDIDRFFEIRCELLGIVVSESEHTIDSSIRLPDFRFLVWCCVSIKTDFEFIAQCQVLCESKTQNY